MQDIYIVGAGGLGSEIVWLLEDINSVKPTFNFKGFLINNPQFTEITIGTKRYPVGDEDKFIAEGEKNKGVAIFVAIGTPWLMKKVVNKYKSTGNYEFPNLVHPGTKKHDDSFKIGEGNLIAIGCRFTVHVTLGNHNLFTHSATVGHDTVLGDFNVINPGANISGNVTIGNDNLIGTNCTILQGLKIGDRSTLAAASFVAQPVGDDSTVIGNPGRVIAIKK